MAVQITIRDVPETVRDELAARAALQGQSMQSFLRGELGRMASRPTSSALMQEIRRRKTAMGTRVPAASILHARDADRK